jgi:hypothetical protein
MLTDELAGEKVKFVTGIAIGTAAWVGFKDCWNGSDATLAGGSLMLMLLFMLMLLLLLLKLLLLYPT